MIGSRDWGGEGEIWITFGYHTLGPPAVCSLVAKLRELAIGV
jgi:hypothetical protein